MATRLLAFLSDIERALSVEQPLPSGGSWDNSRSVNYELGVARLAIASKRGDESTSSGTVLLQSFRLADGTISLKATLNWEGSQAASVHSIFAKPALEWSTEARRIASAWRSGPPRSEFRSVSAPAEVAIAIAG